LTKDSGVRYASTVRSTSERPAAGTRLAP
jgi:hypothetical protein